ncbi:MAG: hypothetical protein U1E92_03345 [Moraxella osloensis]
MAGSSILTQKIGDKVQLVGDDLFVTNPKILLLKVSTNTLPMRFY